MVNDIKNVNTTVTQRKINAKQQTATDSNEIEEKPDKDEEKVKQRKIQYVVNFKEGIVNNKQITTFDKRLCLSN